jgi:REP element-mobilizing transposase RayT
MDSKKGFHRRSIRLKEYDYCSVGDYFVTIVTHQRMPLFGRIHDGEMQLNMAGKVVYDSWKSIPDHFPGVEIGPFVIMPNHIHGVISRIDEIGCRGTACRAPTHGPINDENSHKDGFGKPFSGSIPTIVRSFKSAVTNELHRLQSDYDVHIWQRNYYEHIIGSDKEYEQIENYIANNPANWCTDDERIDIE